VEEPFIGSARGSDLLDALDQLAGEIHAGFRPAHAKGLTCAGTFHPSREAAELTRAPHAVRPSTHVTVRYSDATGLLTIRDDDPARSGSRGIAVRFHLAEHVHTDIVVHSTDGFPVRTGEEFLEFPRAVAASGAGRPEALQTFLAAHSPLGASSRRPGRSRTTPDWRWSILQSLAGPEERSRSDAF
jgi:catalase